MDPENLNFMVIYSAWDSEKRLNSCRSCWDFYAKVGEDWVKLLLFFDLKVHIRRHGLMANAMSAKWKNMVLRFMANVMASWRTPWVMKCYFFHFSSRLGGFWLPCHNQRHGERFECRICPFSPFFAIFIPISCTKTPT